MSLYSRIFGENPDAVALLGMIGCTRDSFMRYRDIELIKEGTIIRVIARIGGPYKKECRQTYNNIKKNKLFIRTYEDDFDDTYCYFEFDIPEQYKHVCKVMAPKEEPMSVGDKFKKEVSDSNIPGSDAEKRMNAIAEEIMRHIESGDHFIGI